MIVLLNCSISLSANNPQLFYGGANDSVLISYDDLRTVNSKLIELKYEKDINIKLKTIISNDSTIISSYDTLARIHYNNNRRLTRQRNILGGISVVTIISTILLLIK